MTRKQQYAVAAVLGAAALVIAAWFAAHRVVAWIDYSRGMEARARYDYAQASMYLERAAKRVPSSDEYRNRAQYMRGIHLYNERKSSAALKELVPLLDIYPDDRWLQTLVRSARVNEAWAARDHVAYLRHAEELYAFAPDDPQAVMTMAAGNAYRWAETGDEKFRVASERYLARLGEMEHELDEPVARIRRCLATRVIQHD